VYLNLVLEYIPETVYKVARHYSKSKQTIPISFIKVSDYITFYYYTLSVTVHSSCKLPTSIFA